MKNKENSARKSKIYVDIKREFRGKYRILRSVYGWDKVSELKMKSTQGKTVEAYDDIKESEYKPKDIVFDFDGVIVDTQSISIDIMNKECGTNYTRDDWKIYDCFKAFGQECGKVVFNTFFLDLCHSKENKIAKCIPGVVNLISRLSYFNNVSIASICMSKDNLDGKIRYINEVGIADNVGFYGITDGDKKSIKCYAAIDDCEQELMKIDAEVKILFVSPWNTECDIEKLNENSEKCRWYKASTTCGILNILKSEGVAEIRSTIKRGR